MPAEASDSGDGASADKQETPERPRVDLADISDTGVESMARTDARAKEEFRQLVKDGEAQQRLDQAVAEGAWQDLEERKKYALRIFVLMCCWLGLLFALLFVAGWAPLGFELSDSVLLALIGGTTANVLGIFVLVARYLFWRSKA